MHARKARAVEKQIVENLRRAIKDSGKTDEKIALEAGITKPALSMILSGKRRPMLLTMIRLAYGVNRPLSELVRTNEAKPKS